jgi:hypothetical protein
MSALVYKIIKPQRLRQDAMRLELLNGIRRVTKGVKTDFEKTTSSWDEEVIFEEQISLAGGPQGEVFTTNKIYGYVDKGTPAHDIWAGYYTGKSDKKTLAFSSRSTPKTTPGIIGSGPGSVGKTDTYTPHVRHPGGRPRNFSKEIEKIWQPKFKRETEATMSKVAKASGHSL